MSNTTDICMLDYLAGTLATAYKGLIASLVAKDFCIRESDGTTVITGSVLAMPEGEYEASLIREGAEIARAGIKDGCFEMTMEAGLLSSTNNLQIDIIQKGKHIGTFLLKREIVGGSFASAIELSEELRETNFSLLASYLKNRPGMLKRAEDIIARVHSTKKDWPGFSDEIQRFAKDLFWSDRDIFFKWYPALVRQSVKACEATDLSDGFKPISNLLSMIELPFENEQDARRLREIAEIWLREAIARGPNFSHVFGQTVRVLRLIHEKSPSADLSQIVHRLLQALKDRIGKSLAIKDSDLNEIRNFIPGPAASVLEEYTETAGQNLLSSISAADQDINESYEGLFRLLGEIGDALPVESEMVNAFFGIVEKNLNEISAAALVNFLSKTFPSLNRLSSAASKSATLNTARIINRLAELHLMSLCRAMLLMISESSWRDQIFLDTQVASAVLSLKDHALLHEYITILNTIMIPSPKVKGFSGETWAEKVDPRHIEILSRFLNVISLDAAALREVLLHVICNLSVTGVYIPDEILFQRQVSSYLNSGAVRSEYFLSLLLLRRLPAFFNEVGATGRLRDDSTEIDSWGNDPVLYFLRKQVHVNASNYNIRLVEAIINAWVYNEPALLKGAAPDDVIGRLEPRLLNTYSPMIRKLFERFGILDNQALRLEKILRVADEELAQWAEDSAASEEAGKKIVLLCRIYRGVMEKYSLSETGGGKGPGDLNQLSSYLGGLKQVALSHEKTIADESLYFKRHIAFGIPSVMGSYHEPKFDALKNTFRAEERLRTFLEGVINEMEAKEKNFSQGDAVRWMGVLDIIHDFFAVQDLRNFQIDELATIFKTNELFTSQLFDMLGIWQRELNWIVEFIYRTFHGPLSEIAHALSETEFLERLRRPGLAGEAEGKAIDVIVRDIISSIPGFPELDRILTAMSATLNKKSRIHDEKIMAAGREETAADFFMIDKLSDYDAMRFGPAIGGKIKNLVYIAKKGLKVPPGVVFTAGHTGNYLEYVDHPDFESVLKRAVREIEERTGQVFGGTEYPLFLSVRSGSYISMPGILSSVLYCGMNRDTLAALIKYTGDPRSGWDSYRRFIEHYVTVVHGHEQTIFDKIRGDAMKKNKAAGPEDMDAEGLEETVMLYTDELEKRGLGIPDDVYAQLKESMKGVYASWYSEKAVHFRRAMNISGHWGTSVAIMQMITGNREGAGASVFFTREPFFMEKGIYGDTRERATGADIVYGSLVNRPLSKKQGRSGVESLEEVDPQLFRLHEELSAEVEEAFGGLPQEVEITYTRDPGGKRVLYVLQTRRMEFYRGFTKRFDDVCRMESNIVGRGTGVHGGALSGVASFSSSVGEIRILRSRSALPLILLRTMADTNDVSLMTEVGGIITSTGGVASHAAVLSQKFDLTAVVGCSDMKIGMDERGEPFAIIGNYKVREGDPISMDGSTGLVYSGSCLFVKETRE